MHCIVWEPSQISRRRSLSFMKQLQRPTTFVTSFQNSIANWPQLRISGERHAKRYTRANCDYSILALRSTVPRSLDQVPVPSIRKYFRRAAHVIQAYAGGCSYKLAQFAHKKYKSHRQIPEHAMEAIVGELEQQ